MLTDHWGVTPQDRPALHHWGTLYGVKDAPRSAVASQGWGRGGLEVGVLPTQVAHSLWAADLCLLHAGGGNVLVKWNQMKSQVQSDMLLTGCWGPHAPRGGVPESMNCVQNLMGAAFVYGEHP